ncbi:uncharacterized protein DFL_001945 [Arthrobotrys flagrans]|uniref:Mid2 domain-containing protein n=1 Tax=Arthrobotrys flagrans TaxID=97331 RepID=A0A437A936_ARTFL|nr:hypothetical protein DFL_001945 [Arthrobotrys flagrans]
MSSTATRNVLGPLTTTFTPNPSCTVPAIYCTADSFCFAWQAQTCIRGLGPIDQSFCWPPWTTGAATSSTPGALNGWGLYSPGLFPVTAGETAIGCCPSGYFCQQAESAQTCVFTATSTTFDAVVCSGFVRSPTEYIIPTSYTTVENSEASVVKISTQTFFAPLFQLNWRSVDLPSSSSNTRSSSVSQTQTNGPTNTSDSGEGGSGGDGGGLSTGAKAGIGAGVGVVALFLLGALIWFWKSRKRRDYGDMPMLPPPAGGPAEFYNEDKRPVEASAEQVRTELPTSLHSGESQTWELESRTPEQHVQLISRAPNGY